MAASPLRKSADIWGNVCLISFLLLTNILFAQKRVTREPRPSWIDKPQPGYFIGISQKLPEEADARAEALQNAKRQIIESLGSIIESQFMDSILERSGEINSQNAFTNSRVKVIAKNIIAVKPEKFFVEQYQEGSGGKARQLYQAFVAVYFDEAAHRATMEQLVAETVRLGAENLTIGKNNAQQGKLFTALAQINAISENLKPLFGMTGLSVEETSKLTSLQDEINALNESLKTSLRTAISGDKQLTKWGLPLKNPLAVRLYYLFDNQEISLEGVVVNFAVTEGKALLNSQAITDSKGVALCELREIQTAGKVTLKIDPQLPSEYKLPNLNTTITLFPDNKAIVRILELNLGNPVNPTQFESALQGKLSSLGFQIIENNPFKNMSSAQLDNVSANEALNLAAKSGADLLIYGTLVSEQPSKVQDNFYFARARGVVKVYNVTRQVVVGSYQKEEKDAGNSPENAGMKALKKVSQNLEQTILTSLNLSAGY